MARSQRPPPNKKPSRNSRRQDASRRGPRLPSSLRRELDHRHNHEKEDPLPPSSLPSDIYEYEESEAPEDSCRNRRFDDVDRLEYELPSDFEDEEIDEKAADGEEELSDQVSGGDEDNAEEEGGSDSQDDLGTYQEGKGQDIHIGDHDEQLYSDETDGDDDTDDDCDDERHQRMIKAIRKTSNDKKQKKAEHVELLSEAYPESEFNINPSSDAGNSQCITVEDLMAPLQGTTGFGSLRKRMHQLDRKGTVVDAPLPKATQERLERKAGYDQTSEDISKWQDIVKKNREEPTIILTKKPELTATSTAELVSKFEPSTNLEKQVASLLRENGLDAATLEGENSLGFNKISIDEVKERQQKLAKMRSILFYHEAKAKRMKKIKSKTFHRLLQKNQKSKDELDPETMKEEALKAEYKRAQERMTLKHKNTSKWAKRIIQRGLKAKDNGTREAISEQLRVHASLTRKMHSTDVASSSDDSSDDEVAANGENEITERIPSRNTKAKLLAKAKVETMKVLEGDAEAEIPTSGIFSLPFMARAIEKKRLQAANEAAAVLEQLEHLEHNEDDVEFASNRTQDVDQSSGRFAFGSMAKSILSVNGKELEMVVEAGSGSDEDNSEENALVTSANRKTKHKKRKLDSDILKFNSHEFPLPRDVSLVESSKVIKEVDSVPHESGSGVIVNPWLFGKENAGLTPDFKLATPSTHATKEEQSGCITSTSIGIVTVAGNLSTKRIKNSEKVVGTQNDSVSLVSEQSKNVHLVKNDESEDDDGFEQGFKPVTGNASQAELIQRAFAGDDVEADFEQLKEQALNEEVPKGKGEPTLPGWGQWTAVQKKRGLPAWILKEQEELRKKRDVAVKKRKDFKLKHVIISEKIDQKAQKFLAPSVPFPYKSRELFERSIRMPLGREFNTDEAFRDMIRPAVIKDAGVIIDPIKYKLSQERPGNTQKLRARRK